MVKCELSNKILDNLVKHVYSLLTRDCYCTREIKMRIAMTKEAFSRKISLLTSKLNIALKKKLVGCYVCFIWPRYLDIKKIGAEVFGKLWNVALQENGKDKIIREINS